MSRANVPIRFDKFDVSKVVIEKPQKNAMVDSQMMSYPRYEGKQVLVQTPMMKIVAGGIPSADSKYHTDAKSRGNNFKLPFDPENPDAVKFMEKMEALDAHFASDDFKKSLFDKPDQYIYQSIVREPVNMDDDDDDDDAPKKKKNDVVRPKYMKIKVAMEWESDRVLTSVFQKDEDGKMVRLDTPTIDDLAKVVRYQSSARFVLMANKFYVTKQKDVKTGKKTYGITFKVQQIEVEPVKAAGGKFDYEAPVFDLGEDEDETSVHENVAKITLNAAEDEEEEDNAALDAGVEEEEEEEKPKKKEKSKKSKSSHA
jgi:hypothetical protein